MGFEFYLIITAISSVLFGVWIGACIIRRHKREEPIGTLRIFTSDPDEAPYIFLELNKNVGDVSKRSQALVNITTDSYISQK